MIYHQSCETCKNFGNCGCDDLREREYLRREGKDCYKSTNNTCKKCENWKYERLGIGYKFCPYCGRVLDI